MNTAPWPCSNQQDTAVRAARRASKGAWDIIGISGRDVLLCTSQDPRLAGQRRDGDATRVCRAVQLSEDRSQMETPAAPTGRKRA